MSEMTAAADAGGSRRSKATYSSIVCARPVVGSGGAGGRGRTDTPFGNTILSRARLPIPPHRPGASYSVKSLHSQTKRRGFVVMKLAAFCARECAVASWNVPFRSFPDERRSPQHVLAQIPQGGRRHLPAGDRKGHPSGGGRWPAER